MGGAETQVRPGALCLPKGRAGVAVAFEVRSHEELHALLNEWAEMIPAEFEVIPLVDPGKAKAYLDRKKPGSTLARLVTICLAAVQAQSQFFAADWV